MIAHVFKTRRRNAVGKVETARLYRGRFRLNGDFTINEVALGTTDRQVAEKKLAEIVAERERERAGLLAPKMQRESAKQALLAHLADFVADLTTLGRSAIYRRMVKARIAKLCAECGWKHPGEVTPDSFVTWRSRQAKLGPKTLNEYLNGANAFLNWMERHGRIAANPLKRVPPTDTRGRQEKRRAFSDDEFNQLLAVAGPHRLLYLTAAYTGLRSNELRQLVWGDLKLDHERPHIVVRAGTTKNRREALLPIHPELLPELRAAKTPNIGDDHPVFTRCNNPDRLIRLHMTAANIARIDALGRKIVFHSLRHTFATKLAVAGVPQRLAQELMRHSDPRLTANIYTDVTRLPTFDAVRGLAWHAERKTPGVLPAATDTVIDTQNLGAAGQKPTQPVTAIDAVNVTETSASEGVCPHLARADTDLKMAEREGFEPSVALRQHMISNHAHSTTLPPLRDAGGPA